jgi:type IV secretion system protein VirB4
MMSNELYLTLVYRPNVSRVSRALQSARRSREEIAQARADALRVMDEKTALVGRVLRGFEPQLLGVRRRDGRDYSEVAEFLGYLVNGRFAPEPVRPGRCTAACRLPHLLRRRQARDPPRRRARYAAFVDLQEYADAVEPGS